MAGIKRRRDETEAVKVKKAKSHPSAVDQKLVNTVRLSRVKKSARLPSPEDSGGENNNGLEDLSTKDSSGKLEKDVARTQITTNTLQYGSKLVNPAPLEGGKGWMNGSSSRESHVKQKALVQERRAAKPYADSIARSKKIWERLRRKSHVPKDERKTLVAELFEIISGRVKDFVFKHDSVRVIQAAIKYGNLEQRRQIANELKGEYRALTESRYAKFLVAKLVVGDEQIRDLVIPEFYGHVKRLIRQPEAAWLLDDMYRTVATPDQKHRLLREWYGHEFMIFRSPADAQPTTELSAILATHPEKKSPIMQHLKEMTNRLIQKKTTGFTMLHDALLQYFINCTPGGTEAAEVIQMLKDDEDGDCLKNLAFTESGARLVCLALAYGNAKDRRAIVKAYKGVIKMLAADTRGHCILLTCFDVIDDTVMTSKAILPELLSKELGEEQRRSELQSQIEHLTARIPLLYLLSSGLPRWLLSSQDIQILEEIHQISKTTSKKDGHARRGELVKVISQPLLDLVPQLSKVLVSSTVGCQFITEILFGAAGDKTAALKSVASLARDEPEVMNTPHAGRMLKSLVQGGPFDKGKKEIQVVEPPLGFEKTLYSHCRGRIAEWASGANSFVVVALLESPRLEETEQKELVEVIRGKTKTLQAAAAGSQEKKSNAGAQIVLQKIHERQ